MARFAFRPNLRTRRAKSVFIDPILAAATSTTLEALEQRVLMCGFEHSDANHPPTDDPAQVAILMAHDHHGSEWHVSRADLNAAELAVIDPHFVLGHDAVPAEHLNVAAKTPQVVTEVLPDVYPTISGSPNINQTLQPGRTLLRFGTQVNNMGNGPATLISGTASQTPPAGMPFTSWVNADGTQNVVQNIYSYNNVTNQFTLTRQRAAGKFVYHAGHSHFHYEGYANYSLMTRNPDGSVGAVAKRSDGTPVLGAKIGFCLININGSFTMPNGQSSQTLAGYSGSGQPNTSCGFLQGISVGQADVYNATLEGQWIDVTDVPNGSYFIGISLDNAGAMDESNESNNTGYFAYTLNANAPSGGITPDEYDSGGRSNDSVESAVDLGEMGVEEVDGLNIDSGVDEDWFKFTATSTGTVQLDCVYTNGDVNLYIFNGNRVEIVQATSDTPGSTGSPATDRVTTLFTAGQTYYVKTIAYNSTRSNNYALRFKILPTVSNSAPRPQTSEIRGDTGSFTVKRNGPTSAPITMTLAIGGTAQRDVDYTLSSPNALLNGNTLIIGDLQSKATILVTPIKDGVGEGNETVTLSIAGTAAFVTGGMTSTVIILESARLPSNGPVIPGPRGLTAPGSPPSPFANEAKIGLLGDDRNDDLLIGSALM